MSWAFIKGICRKPTGQITAGSFLIILQVTQQHSTLGSINEDLHTRAASRFLYAPRSCCRFCFDDPALVSPTCEDEKFFSFLEPLFLFYRRINSGARGAQPHNYTK